MSALIDLRSQPWWTLADQAELDQRTHALVGEVFDHRAGCEVCASGYPPCPFVREAIEAVVNWRDASVLQSKALWLRLRQARLEEQV